LHTSAVFREEFENDLQKIHNRRRREPHRRQHQHAAVDGGHVKKYNLRILMILTRNPASFSRRIRKWPSKNS